MAIRGTLILGEAGDGSPVWRIIHLDYAFNQPTDSFGQPSSRVSGGFINLTVESSGRDLDLIRWMLRNEAVQDGGAFFYSREGREVRSVEFRRAYCISFKETFSALDDEFMKIEFRLTCGEITIDGGDSELIFTRDWSVEEGNSASSASSPSSSSSSASSSSGSSSSSDGVSSFNPND